MKKRRAGEWIPTTPQGCEPKPARADIIVLKQLLNSIPRSLLKQTARKAGVDTQARTFSVLSHLASMLFAQLLHAIRLNDVCDSLRLKAAALSRLQIVPPSRNTLSHANKVRSADFIKMLFCSVLEPLQNIQPGFASGKKGKGLLRRSKVRIHAVDFTVMELVANQIGWAKHRRRKATAKMYLRLDLHSFLPSFAVVDTAAHHNNKRVREVCAGISPGEIVVFDKAYVDFEHLRDLDQREFWQGSRAKENMADKVKKPLTKGVKGTLKDQLVVLKNAKHEGVLLRRVEVLVEIDGEERLMVVTTNNLSWSPRLVCDFQRRRWDIEVFFKQVKQTLKLSNFLGHSANAVRWQVYTALLVSGLLRFQEFLSACAHSFTRLFAVVRSAVLERLDLLGLLKNDGTASGRFMKPGSCSGSLGCPPPAAQNIPSKT